MNNILQRLNPRLNFSPPVWCYRSQYFDTLEKKRRRNSVVGFLFVSFTKYLCIPRSVASCDEILCRLSKRTFSPKNLQPNQLQGKISFCVWKNENFCVQKKRFLLLRNFRPFRILFLVKRNIIRNMASLNIIMGVSFTFWILLFDFSFFRSFDKTTRR